MVEILLLTLAVLLPLLLVLAAGAVDLVRRDVSFWPGLSVLGLVGVLQMLAGGLRVYDQGLRDRGWRLLWSLARDLAEMLMLFSFAGCAMVLVLAMSRALRPEGGGPWRKGRVLLGWGLFRYRLAVPARRERQLPASGDVVPELPRSPVWTVQDAISICATFPRAKCALSGP